MDAKAPGRRPRDIDIHVGRRVRARRKSLGLSLDALAAALGVAYQQVQKYETGANRISASMLYEIAEALRTPVGHFYEGLPGSAAPGDVEAGPRLASVDAVLATPGGRDLLDAFVTMPRHLRRPFIALARGVAEPQGKTAEDAVVTCLPTWR